MPKLEELEKEIPDTYRIDYEEPWACPEDSGEYVDKGAAGGSPLVLRINCR